MPPPSGVPTRRFRLGGIDLLVEFAPDEPPPSLERIQDFATTLEQVLGRPVDIVERAAVESSRNYIRRRRILAEAEPLHG